MRDSSVHATNKTALQSLALSLSAGVRLTNIPLLRPLIELCFHKQKFNIVKSLTNSIVYCDAHFRAINLELPKYLRYITFLYIM